MTGFSFCTMVHKIRTRFVLVAKGSSKDCILKKKIENYPGREEDFRRKTTEEEYLEEAYWSDVKGQKCRFTSTKVDLMSQSLIRLKIVWLLEIESSILNLTKASKEPEPEDVERMADFVGNKSLVNSKGLGLEQKIFVYEQNSY